MLNRKHNYYSQHGEDFLLWEFFRHKTTGFFVDVGAFDGIHLSNTFSFERERWTGICIEPHPLYFVYCKKSRPNSLCINSACTATDEQNVKFYSEEMGLLSSLMDRHEEVKARYEGRGLSFDGLLEITVPAASLNAILRQTVPARTSIDFISIDVEGAEISVLKGMDLNMFTPRILVLEANTPEEQFALDNYLKVFGFRRARVLGINAFYAKSILDCMRLASINVNCELEATQHPLGPKFTTSEYGSKRKMVSTVSFRQQVCQTVDFLLHR